jgi:catechol 2,3-dioxygenase-like lactoylglutathione lyase family enzyme
MNLDCKHIEVRVSNLLKSKDFYIQKLGLTLLDDKPNFFAAQVGELRISFLGGNKFLDLNLEETIGTSIIFSTEDIESTRNELLQKGVKIIIDITNANNYLKFITIEDPDGLSVSIAEYLVTDLLEKKV